MKVFASVILFLFVLAGNLTGQNPVFKFWVQLNDKAGTPYSLDNPEEFLSQRSIERRQRFGIPLEWNDLPVSPRYIDSLQQHDLQVLYGSKWMNALIIETADSGLASQLSSKAYVSSVDFLYKTPSPSLKSHNDKWMEPVSLMMEQLLSYDQMAMLQGHRLHEMGYKGQGMVIAVLDAGFSGTDTISGFDSLYLNQQVLGTRNFVEHGTSVYQLGDHGTHVLSLMGGNIPGVFLGTAPSASYWLIHTEDTLSEFRIEEANWLAGAELADSAGADIINSSVGYSNEFTLPGMNYEYSDMDGNTTLVTRAADLAASKGLLVVNSAGNSGRPTNPWQYIIAPSDGDSVLAVGAVDPEGFRAVFSSRGPTFDGRVKPDVAAQGYPAVLLRSWGAIGTGKGTSFASPIIAGLAGCLWQKHPDLNNAEIMDVIRTSSDQYPWPDHLLGYGKPNFRVADWTITGLEHEGNRDIQLSIFPNPAGEFLHCSFPPEVKLPVQYRISDLGGRYIQSGELPASGNGIGIIPLSDIAAGAYLLQIQGHGSSFSNLFIKQ